MEKEFPTDESFPVFPGVTSFPFPSYVTNRTVSRRDPVPLFSETSPVNGINFDRHSKSQGLSLSTV